MSLPPMTAVFIVAVVSIVSVNGFASGPPLSACVTRTPNHGVEPQNSNVTACPYSMNAHFYIPGKPVEMVLQSNTDKEFKGFLLSAQHPNGSLIGSWDFIPVNGGPGSESVKKACQDTSLSHADNTGKKFVVMLYTAPVDLDPEIGLFIRYTVVQDYSTFWVDCNPFILRANPDLVNTATATTTTESVITTEKPVTTTEAPTTTTTKAPTTTTKAPTTTTGTTTKAPTTTTKAPTTTTKAPTTTTKATTATPTKAKTTTQAPTTTTKSSTTTTQAPTTTTKAPTTTTQAPTTTTKAPTTTTTAATTTTTAATTKAPTTTQAPTKATTTTQAPTKAITTTQVPTEATTTTQAPTTTTTKAPTSTAKAPTTTTTQASTTTTNEVMTTSTHTPTTTTSGKPISGGVKETGGGNSGNKPVVDREEIDVPVEPSGGYIEGFEVESGTVPNELPIDHLSHEVISDVECREAGNSYVIVENSDCRRFYQIWAWGRYERSCPGGLQFNARNCACSWTGICSK